MSAGEVIHTSDTGGQKAGNLERYDLIPTFPLLELARLYSGPPQPPASIAGLNYELWNFWDGRDVDPFVDLHPLTFVAHEAIELIRLHVGDTWRPDPGATGFERIPPGPIRLLAEHFGRGARKYADHNWRRGYPWGLSYAALNRHLGAHRSGEFIDQETGSLHLVAVLWHAFTLLTFTQEHPELDDRWSTVSKKPT